MSGTNALRTIIVDDEPLARQVLREYLAGMPAVEVVAECANGFEAVKAVAEQAPDLVLLDVQMPKLDGFEVVELIGRATPVIFVTAYDEFAVRAFEVHAVDYLLKPVSAERLAEAIARVRLRDAGAAGDAAGLGAAAAGQRARTRRADPGPRRDARPRHRRRRPRLRAGARRLRGLPFGRAGVPEGAAAGRGRSRARSRAPSSASIARSSST